MSNINTEVDTQLRARTQQLWAEFGHPTQELLDLNKQYNAREIESLAKDDDEKASQQNSTGLVHPRIFEIQNAVLNRWPRRPTEIGHPLMMDANIHTHWKRFIEAAKRFEVDDPNHSALVVELLALRNITLQHQFKDELVPAYASNGQKIWTDLPYFYEDIQSALIREESHALTKDHRTNLSAFVARLASIGVFDKDFFGLALVLFRDSFEEFSGPNDALIEDLLPAVNAWFMLARHQIEALVDKGFRVFDPVLSSPGKLAPKGCPDGFQLARFKFWGQRLEEWKKSENKEVAKEAESIFSWWEMIDSHTLGGGQGEKGFETKYPGRFWVSGQKEK